MRVRRRKLAKRSFPATVRYPIIKHFEIRNEEILNPSLGNSYIM